MVRIGKQIIQDIINADIVEDVRDYNSTDEPIFDMITVNEIPTNEGIEVDGQPRITKNYFEFEIYCQPKIVNGIVKNAIERINEVSLELDSFLNLTYGMNLIGQPVPAPYSGDSTVMRYFMRYSAFIDNETLQIYRR